jgi:SAM-dependent methyltransferase
MSDRRWDPGHFFATGRDHVAELMAYLDRLHPALPRTTAFDFGCGVGRLTQALCGDFIHVCGVDISPTMIRLAQEFNQWPGQCSYRLNDRPDLSGFASNHWDLIHSHWVLQHLAPAATARYLGEFVRLLSPQGLAVFQLPGRPLWRPAGSEPWDSLDSWGVAGGGAVDARGLQVVMETYGIEKQAVIEIIEKAGGEVLEALPDPSPIPDWENLRYVVRRR